MGLVKAMQIAMAMIFAMIRVQITAKVRLSWEVSMSGPGLMPTAMSAVRTSADRSAAGNAEGESRDVIAGFLGIVRRLPTR